MGCTLCFLSLIEDIDKENYTHHDTLIDIIPALCHHAVEPHPAILRACHQVFIKQSTACSHHSCQYQEEDPLIMLEVYALPFTAPCQ